jgi:hypothetical protein
VICCGNFACQFTLVGFLCCTEKNLAWTLELVTLLSKAT